MSKANRIIVFDVGGTIKITTRIAVSKNIYIAGQTAPGDVCGVQFIIWRVMDANDGI